MFMDYETPLEGIRLAIAAAIGAPDRIVMGKPQRAVEWEHRRTAARWTKGVWADLSIHGWEDIGRDMTKSLLISVQDPDPGALPGTMRDMVVDACMGNRAFYTTVVIRSDSQEPGKLAVIYADRLRTRLGYQRIRNLYKSAGAGFSYMNVAWTNDGVGADERFLSEAVVDIQWVLGVTDIDEPDFAADYVGEVEAVGTLSTARNGTDVTVQIDTDPSTHP